MNKPIPKHKYLLKPSLPDIRDLKYQIVEREILPDSVDLRDQCSPIMDQGNLGSCSANAGSAAYEFLQLKYLKLKKLAPEEFSKQFTPVSRLFLYYCERALENSISQDSGATLRDCVTALSKWGTCPEEKWAYDISKFNENPPEACWGIAAKHKIKKYQRVNGLIAIKDVLAAGHPVIAGIVVYESFESEQAYTTGEIPVPTSFEQALGGHAILLVGYNEDKRHVIFRNSWGTGFGQKGYGFLPYDYVCNSDLLMETWAITL